MGRDRPRRIGFEFLKQWLRRFKRPCADESRLLTTHYNSFYPESFDGKWIFMKEIIKEIARIDKELEKEIKARFPDTTRGKRFT